MLRRCKRKIVSLRNIELINLSPFQIGHSFNKWPPTVVFLNIRWTTFYFSYKQKLCTASNMYIVGPASSTM